MSLFEWAEPKVLVERPVEWAGLPGTFRARIATDHADFYLAHMAAVLVEHDISPARRPRSIRYAGYVAVDREMLLDDFDAVWPSVLASTDRAIRPWLRPDTYTWPKIDLFPRVSRWRGAIRAVGERIARHHRRRRGYDR